MSDNSALFSISYDGPALASHEMNVKDLAPALLAVGELLEEANRVLNGDGVKIAVNMKATEKGSVEVMLSVAQSLPGALVGLFTNNQATAIVNAYTLLQILGLAGKGSVLGLFQILKWIKGRPIKNVVRLDAGNVRIELENGEARVATLSEIKLLGIMSIRKSVEAVVKPLHNPGVSKVAFIVDREREEILKEEADSFAAPVVEEEVINQTVSRTSLQIVSVTFQEGGKWKFNDGGSVFFADILDEEFSARIQRNEVAFAKDDILTVDLRTKQSL